MEILDLQPYQVGPMERIGSRNDGGYVIPRWLPEKMTLISFGIGDNWSFEKSCLKKKIASNSIMFDHTVGLGIFLSRIQSQLFTKKFAIKSLLYRVLVALKYARDFSHKSLIHVKKEITRDLNSEKKTNLLDVVKNLGIAHFILKVDIEGTEYEIMEQIVSLNKMIPVLLIESHETEKCRQSFEESLNLLKKNFILAHTHANNYSGLSSDGIPRTVELTFCNKDYYVIEKKVLKLPVCGLDQASAPDRPDISLKF